MKNTLLMLILSTFVVFGVLAQEKKERIELKYGSQRVTKRTDEQMQRWREYGLGQFIHWGIYAIPGGHWDGQYYNNAAEWIRVWSEKGPDGNRRSKQFNGVPFTQIYDQLYKEFNPKDFDAAKWAQQAKDMGVKYVIFTTKHHDGFCMWPSKYTDYTIANTPYKKDIVKQVVDEYSKRGIDVYLYFSIIDWNHKGYRSAIPTGEKQVDEYNDFLQFTRNQIMELLENYPQTKGMWFDGSWDKSWIAEHKFHFDLEKEMLAKHPGLILGSRFRTDEYGNRNFDSNGDIMGDYEQGWERDIPTSFDVVKNNDWDCVMTVPENQWGYHSDWKGYVKTPYDLIEMLARCVSMNGNLVVNFGPTGTGAIRPEESDIATEMGKWMRTNGEAIYGTSHVDVPVQGWGYYTGKGNKLYMIVFNRSISNKLRIEIPKGGDNPKAARILGSTAAVKIENAGKNKQNSNLYNIAIPANYISTQPFVIVLDMEASGEGESYQQART